MNVLGFERKKVKKNTKHLHLQIKRSIRKNKKIRKKSGYGVDRKEDFF